MEEHFDIRMFSEPEYLKSAKNRMKVVKVSNKIFFFFIFNFVKDFAKYTSKMRPEIRKSYDLLSEAVTLEKNDIVKYICKNYSNFLQNTLWVYNINSGIIFKTLHEYFPIIIMRNLSVLTYASFRKENIDIVDTIIELYPKSSDVEKGIKNFIESSSPIDQDSMMKIIINFEDVIASAKDWSINVKNESTAKILFNYNLMNKINFTSLNFSVEFYRDYAFALKIDQYIVEKNINQIVRFIFSFFCNIKVDVEFLLEDKRKYSHLFDKTINFEILDKLTPFIVPDESGKNQKGEDCIYTKEEIRLIFGNIKATRKFFTNFGNSWS